MLIYSVVCVLLYEKNGAEYSNEAPCFCTTMRLLTPLGLRSPPPVSVDSNWPLTHLIGQIWPAAIIICFQILSANSRGTTTRPTMKWSRLLFSGFGSNQQTSI